MEVNAGTGLVQRILTLEEEMRIQRQRSHDYGNRLTEQGAQIEDAREDIRDLSHEIARRFDAQKADTDSRFDRLSSQAWKITGFVVTVMLLAATIVGLLVH